MLVAEVEVGHFLPVGFGGYHRDGVLLVEELEHKGEVVGVQEELCKVFKLEHVCSPSVSTRNIPYHSHKLTRNPQPL